MSPTTKEDRDECGVDRGVLELLFGVARGVRRGVRRGEAPVSKKYERGGRMPETVLRTPVSTWPTVGRATIGSEGMLVTSLLMEYGGPE